MKPLRLPSSHPNASVLHDWARDKETLINNHEKDISQLKRIIQTIVRNNPKLGVPPTNAS